jgi:hypothetical protein
MSIEEVSAERFAELFHHYHQALRADGNASSDPQTESWDQVPNKRRDAWFRRLGSFYWNCQWTIPSKKPGGISLSRVKQNGAADWLPLR